MQPPLSPNTLDDPGVRADLEQRKASKLKATRRHARGLEQLLAHCPWREYGYKLGRWERVEFHDFVAFRWITWEHTPMVQLIDLGSGLPVGELYLDTYLPELAPPLPGPSGRLWAAGSPLSVAALSVHGPRTSIVKATAGHLLTADPQQTAELLVSGREPLPPTPYRPVDRYGRSTWVADCPEKPRRQDGFQWRHGDTDREPWDTIRARSEWRAIGK